MSRMGDFTSGRAAHVIPLVALAALLLLPSCGNSGPIRSQLTVCGDDSKLEHVVVADFNADGNTDIAVACGSKNGWKGYVQVFAGMADGDFRNAHRITFADREPQAVAAVSAPEGKARGLFVASSDSGTRYLSYIPNSDGMAFGAPKQLYANGRQMGRFAVTDVDGDGNDDLVFPIDGFWLQSAGGGAVPQSVYRHRLNNHVLGAGDFGDVSDLNADGRADGAYRVPRAGDIRIYVGGGKRMESLPIGKTVRGVAGVLAVADFNGDGTDDLVLRIGGSLSEARTEIALSQGSDRWSFSDPVAGLTGATQVLVTDVTGDGTPDLVAERYRPAAKKGDHALFVAAGTGDGTFSKARKISISAYPMHLMRADLTGDGKPDIIFGDRENNVIHILSGPLGAS